MSWADFALGYFAVVGLATHVAVLWLLWHVWGPDDTSDEHERGGIG